MDKLDDILANQYKKIKHKIVPRTGECPQEAALWSYVRGELKAEERERIDGHLLTCSECIETLKVIRMLHQAQESSQSSLQVPAPLHQKAREILESEVLESEILENELKKSGLKESGLRAAKDMPPILKLALLWDQMLDRITQVTSELGEMLPAPLPQFQPVRRARQEQRHGQEQGQEPGAFPYARTINIPEGTITLEIDHSGRGEYISLKVSFQPELEVSSQPELEVPFQPELKGATDRVSSPRLILYKSDRICSSVYLDAHGEAAFQRIREGDYHLELLAGERSLGVIDLSLKPTAEK
jgi:hypothetical protein